MYFLVLNLAIFMQRRKSLFWARRGVCDKFFYSCGQTNGKCVPLLIERNQKDFKILLSFSTTGHNRSISSPTSGRISVAQVGRHPLAFWGVTATLFHPSLEDAFHNVALVEGACFCVFFLTNEVSPNLILVHFQKLC